MKKALIIPVLAVFLATCFFFPCSAADVYVADSFDYWTGGTYTWSIEPSGAEYGFIASSFESTLDWSNPFPDNELVRKGYVSTINQGTLLLAFVFPLFCLPLRLSVALYGECDEL